MTKGRVIERQNRELAMTDAMPAGLRECVHEYGLTIVEHLMKHGVKNPAAIRELVRVIWDGARQPAQRLYGPAGSSVINRLDWVLMQAGCPLSARALARVLNDSNYVIAPIHPTAGMIEASMDAIAGMGVLSKREKHQIRLRMAMKSAQADLWAPPAKGSGSRLADATPKSNPRGQ